MASRVDPTIFEGDEAGTCAWPTAVLVTRPQALCSGTLIHPEVVVFAGVCGFDGSTEILFGENRQDPRATVSPAQCFVNPDYSGISDGADNIAVCRLASPVDLPATPPLLGCELNELQVGREVAVVGFGEFNANSTGNFAMEKKRWGLTEITGVSESNNVATLGGGGEPSGCASDNGGPGFIQMPDGGWRTWGLMSSSAGCGTVSTYTLLYKHLPWIEDATDVDVTPCHTADGVWDPGPRCGNVMAGEAGQANGAWDDGCLGADVTGPLETCGPAYDPGGESESGAGEEGGSGEAGSETGSESSESAGSNDEGSGRGCACAADDPRHGGAVLAWLGLMGLGLRRRGR